MEYQWARVIYQYRKLPAIRDGLYPQFGGNLEFELYTFFEVCYHLKDWIKADERYSNMSNVEKYIDNTPALRICADLCNRLKHRRLERKIRSEQTPGVFQIHKTISVGPKGYDAKSAIDSAVVITERGNECCFELALECVESWKNFLNENNIECDFS
ncbi:hypothetical protein EJ063_19455 [Vibrio aquaticus]|uniref:Uncharacterized protein n=1 Tax=Vibrio aquaticus TaxID=2496559 RepID=A0A3S0P3M5_9VIBR|nr:hypothetical protein [Vibrio aquaticus]RTZ13590.1 hypothetical protein EJ063_19455 [Vibrio aquaticus]